MKTVFALLLMTLSSSAFALTARTQDNINFIVIVRPEASYEQCARTVCAIAQNNGTGLCEPIGEIVKLVRANLTAQAAFTVSQLPCVGGMEAEGNVGPYPRVGRGN